MLEDFINFNRKENLFSEDQKILLAVSGGIDSIILSKLFQLAKLNFGIAHVNFGLRGEESLADEIFVKKWAKTLKVPYHTIYFDTNAYAEKEKLSIQMAARILRYQWFEEIRVQEKYDLIATAHHQMDNAETIFINLLRGTGLAGFHGIPIKNGNIIRPMAFASQEDIFDFVVQHKLAWREDSSNSSTKYQRNFIRHEIMPKLIELNDHLEKTMSETSEKIRDIEYWIKEECDIWSQQFVTVDENGNQFVALTENNPSKKSKVINQRFLSELNFNHEQINQIIACQGEEKTGKIFESPSHVLNIDRNQWVISSKDYSEFRPTLIQEEDEKIAFGNQTIQIYWEEKDANFVPSTSSKIACLDADKLEFPLEIRKAQEGDWFCPLGMNQKKLVSDFLTDKKVPLNIKKQTMVLLSKGSIVWIIGHRIDNRFKVTDKTEGVCFLEIK
ncbi:tRNA lysidine(34) synthetase TilS [Aquirufa sp. ROCK2-A2]